MYGRRQSEHQHAYPTENANAGGGHRTTSAGFGFGLLDGPRWVTCCALPLVGCLGPAPAEIGQVTWRAGPTWGQRVGLRLYACLPDDDDGRVASLSADSLHQFYAKVNKQRSLSRTVAFHWHVTKLVLERHSRAKRQVHSLDSMNERTGRAMSE
jgi:hypothetical protein